MKKVILLLCAAVLLLCLTSCNSDEIYKGRFAKNIPACVKQRIKEQDWVIRAEEYCSKDDTKKIYIFNEHPQSTVCLFGYDENCNNFIVKSDEYDCRALRPECFVWGEMLPDGTIEYEEDIYSFKRIVFKQR